MILILRAARERKFAANKLRPERRIPYYALLPTFDRPCHPTKTALSVVGSLPPACGYIVAARWREFDLGTVKHLHLDA